VNTWLELLSLAGDDIFLLVAIYTALDILWPKDERSKR
jgi:hypothetical protein